MLFSTAKNYTQRIPVLIVGAGPVGLTLSLLLDRLKVPSLVVDASEGPPRHPQAHYLTSRTMEIFRTIKSCSDSIGSQSSNLAEEIRSKSSAREYWDKFVYCRSLEETSNEYIASFDHSKSQAFETLSSFSPELPNHFPQNHLVPILLGRVKASDYSNCEYRCKLLGFDSGDDSVEAMIDANGEIKKLSCQFLVGADGVNSIIRRKLDISLNGSFNLQSLLNVHFHSKDLAEMLLARERTPAMLYFIYNASAVCVLVAHDLKKGEFACQIPIFEPLQDPSDFTEERMKLILQSLSKITIDLHINSIKCWSLNAAVAESFHEEVNSRVFLAGDACHQFPPSGGLGMNTGIADAHNLAWKLATCIHESTHNRKLLFSYDEERRPIAHQNLERSLENLSKVLKISSALGLDYNLAKASISALSFLPFSSSRKAIIERLLDAGRNTSYIIGNTLKARNMIEQDDGLPLFFPHEDLGLSYSGKPRDPAEVFLNPRVGERFPHFWIDEGTQYSTIDLFASSIKETRIVHPGYESRSDSDLTMNDKMLKVWGSKFKSISIRCDGHISSIV